MPNLTDIVLSSIVDLGIDPSVGPRDTSTPFLVDIFGSAHIATSTPFVGGFSHPSSRRNTGVHSHGGDHRHVNVGVTYYIPFYAPFSTTHVPLDSFLMSYPLHIWQGPLGRGAAYNHVTLSSFCIVLLGGCVHPYMSGSEPTCQSYNYDYVAPHIQVISNYHIPLHPFTGHTGGGYYSIGQGHGIYYNHPYVNQPF